MICKKVTNPCAFTFARHLHLFIADMPAFSLLIILAALNPVRTQIERLSAKVQHLVSHASVFCAVAVYLKRTTGALAHCTHPDT